MSKVFRKLFENIAKLSQNYTIYVDNEVYKHSIQKFSAFPQKSNRERISKHFHKWFENKNFNSKIIEGHSPRFDEDWLIHVSKEK